MDLSSLWIAFSIFISVFSGSNFYKFIMWEIKRQLWFNHNSTYSTFTIYSVCLCVRGGTYFYDRLCCVLLIARGHVDEMNLIWKCYTIYGWRSFVQTGPNTHSLGWLYNCIYWGKGSRICIWTVVISVCRRALDACKIYELPMWNWLEWFIFFCCCCLLPVAVVGASRTLAMTRNFSQMFLLFLKCVTLLLAFGFFF